MWWMLNMHHIYIVSAWISNISAELPLLTPFVVRKKLNSTTKTKPQPCTPGKTWWDANEASNSVFRLVWRRFSEIKAQRALRCWWLNKMLPVAHVLHPALCRQQNSSSSPWDSCCTETHGLIHRYITSDGTLDNITLCNIGTFQPKQWLIWLWDAAEEQSERVRLDGKSQCQAYALKHEICKWSQMFPFVEHFMFLFFFIWEN